MSERKYSLSEIDDMRGDVERIWSCEHNGVSFYEKDRIADVEARLRTYMANGTEPSELQKHAEKVAQEFYAILAARQKRATP